MEQLSCSMWLLKSLSLEVAAAETKRQKAKLSFDLKIKFQEKLFQRRSLEMRN